ncbi:MAG: hypothetical protein HQL22_01955 [Candidatus Omnitrophica bacterium]|nr:hypothetical protein [Candidatus Omnitrophota bacterium]
MGLLAAKRVLCALTAAGSIFIQPEAHADGLMSMYGFSSVDYFVGHTSANHAGKRFTADDLWSQVRSLSGGGTETVRPPLPVMDFLETPNPETGRQYLEWNRQRLEKIMQAQKVLESLP